MTCLPHPSLSKLSARPLVLDGEVAIYDEQLHSHFEWLREPDPAAFASPPRSPPCSCPTTRRSCE
jgi:hypothetical protein